MKFLAILIVTSFVSLTSIAQYKPQIRLKTGISQLYPSPGGTGYAYKMASETSGSVVIGGEFSYPMKNRKAALHFGFTFQDGYTNFSPNPKNIVLSSASATAPSFGFSFVGSPAKTVVYAGFEKYLNRDIKKPSKNYFSVEAGLGFAFTLNKLDGWTYSRSQTYQTKTGEQLEGYISNFEKPKFPLAPSIYGGVRYNITNKIGNEVLIFELMVNYGLTSFYNARLDYKVNGELRHDLLKEKGFNTQLNIIVPLVSFNKNRK